MNADQFTRQQQDEIVERTFVRKVEHHQSLPSTNDRALELCGGDSLETPLLVLTELQTSGRGRGVNQWWSTNGALTFSLVIEPACWQLGPEFHPRISLSVALAVCRTLEQQLSATDVRVKWPNDVYVAGRKACGILVEVPPRRSELLVVGVGVNVNNTFEEAPVELNAATSLFDIDRQRRLLPDVLCAVLREISNGMSAFRQPEFDLSQNWQPRCLLQGRRVRVDAGPRSLIGVCRGIDAQGALMLESEAGIERCLGGVVSWWEPNAPANDSHQ